MKPESINFLSPRIGDFKKILNEKNSLFKLAGKIDWEELEKDLSEGYSKTGRPGVSIRLLCGLMYLKYTFNISDEDLEMRWVENPYWQYFCGFRFLQHKFPIHYTTFIKWRKKFGKEKALKLFSKTVELAIKEKVLPKKDLKHITVDSTVQEKNIAYPTDGALLNKIIQKIGNEAKTLGINLRQSFNRVSKKLSVKVGRYAHAKQFKRMNKSLKKMKTYLGRLTRDVERKYVLLDDSKLSNLIFIGKRLLDQTKRSRNKIYSIHELEVKCISKGKSHKRYEFGQKVSIATTNKSNWIVSMDFLEGNPYDGHRLNEVAKSVEKITKVKIEELHVDKGYRGNNYEGDAEVHISGCGKKKLKKSIKNRKKRRSAIEPKIGHLKSDHRMNRCYLKGILGDEINCILSGAGSNLRKLLGIWRSSLISLFLISFWKQLNLKNNYKPLHVLTF